MLKPCKKWILRRTWLQ